MSAVYLLDTNICIFIRRERPISVLERFRALSQGSVVMSVITYGELYFGIQKARDSQHFLAGLTGLDRLAEMIPCLEMPKDAALNYGVMRADLQRRGEIIGNNDLWIAAHAAAADLTLVTNNRREFDRLGEHVRVEDWSVL